VRIASASKFQLHKELTVSVNLEWQDVALRLAIAFLSAAVIGLDRGERGRTAGLRTTILMSVAACVAMLEANSLMNSVGKAPNSFVTMDVMRLPLGILSGVGFIGAGAILKRGNMVTGVTTAATMWFVTVMGLCFGSGQIKLGLTAFAIALVTLTLLKLIDDYFPSWHPAFLCLTLSADVLSEKELRALLKSAGMKISSWTVHYENRERRRIQCEVRWRPKHAAQAADTPTVIEGLTHQAGVAELEWKS
jgi:putative Mg2+ transporter-C (MgtC) family protein